MNLLRKLAKKRVVTRVRWTTRFVERLETRDLLAVVVGIIPTQVAGVTSLSSFPIATFEPSDVGAASSTGLTATISWGDLSPDSSAAIVPGPGAEFTVVGTHQYVAATPSNAQDPITVTVTNSETDPISTSTGVGTVVVNPAPVTLAASTITVVPGVQFAGTVGSFTSANASARFTDFAASVAWGDGTTTGFGTSAPTSVSIASNPAGGFLVQGTHTYANDELPATTTVTVYDLVGSQQEAVGQTTVANGEAVPPVTGVFTPLSRLIVGSAESPLPQPDIVGSFIYTPPAGAPAPVFSAFINFGDGHVSQGQVVSAGNGLYNVEGTNVYAVAGNYSVGIAVADQIGNSAFIPSSAVVTGPLVNAVGTIFPVTPGVPFTGVVATFTDTNPKAKLIEPTALIDWGNGTLSPGVVSGPDANGLFTVTGTKNYGSSNLPSNFPVTVAITGPDGEPAIVHSTAYILASSSLTITGTTFAVNPASPFTGTVATFKDTNPAAKTTAPSATISWGNGTVSAGMVTGPDANGVFTVTGSIFYLTTSPTGSYPVRVTITDSAGHSVSATSTALMSTPAPPPALTGGLDLGGENGPFASSGFSATNRPTFSGTTVPFALVQLFARRTDVDATLSLGQTVAGANGAWSLGVGPLSQGIFSITAIVTVAGGSPTGPLPVGVGLYYIDTTPPSVVGVSSDGQGHIFVKFQDGLSGMNGTSLQQTVNYTFVNANGSTFHPSIATVLPNAGLPTDVETVELTVGGKPKSAPKTLRITAAGILDNAGNPLAANFHGGITKASYLPKSNPVVKLKAQKPKPAKHRS
jgi:large repetitive protein